MALFADDLIWLIVFGFIVAFILAFGIGANDVANTFGTSVGAKVLTLFQACILASIFETLGSVLLGAKVSDTIRSGILNANEINKTIIAAGNYSQYYYKISMFGQLSALSGSCIWLLIATMLKLPVSGSHSIVGSVVGYALVAYGPKGIHWLEVVKIVASWFVSPLLSGFTTVGMFYLIKRFILNKADPLEPGLFYLPFIYAFTLAVNSFSVFFNGPRLLKFNMIPWWGCIILALGIGAITGVLVFFFLVPWQRRRIQEEIRMIETAAPSSGMTSATTLDKETTDGSGEIVDSKVEVCSLSQSEEISDKPEQARLFSWLQILTAIFGSFAHGGNDVSNAIGPLIGLWQIGIKQDIFYHDETPLYLLAYGGIGISMGLWILGRRVIETMGSNLTKITPSSGSCIELGSALTVLIASNIKLPISTTHCKVGSIVFVGWFRSRKGVNWRLMLNIVLAWFVTLPISGLLSALFMYIFLKTNCPRLI